MHEKLAGGFVAAFNREGAAVSPVVRSVRRMADANKAFAHLAW